VTQEFEVTAEELVRTLQRRGIPLPSEIGAFVVLEACEKLIGRPVLISTRDIFITESGDVECEERQRADSESAAVGALLSVLAELLVCAAPGVPSMLLDLVEHGPNEERLSLPLLRSDLEACLLPLNRGAQRRVLSRLVREVRKSAPGAPGQAVAEEELDDVDATFDDLLRETSPPPIAAPVPSDSAFGLPRGVGSDQPRRAAGELPRGVGSSRPAQVASEVFERSASGQGDEEVTRHHEITSDERGRATKRPRTPAEENIKNTAPQTVRARSGPRAGADAAEHGTGSRSARSRVGVDAAERGDGSRAERGRADAAERGDGSRAERGRADASERGRADASERGDAGSNAPSRRPARGRVGVDAAERSEPDLRAERERRADSAHASLGRRSRAPVDLDALEESPNASRGRIGLWVFLGTTAAAVAMLLGYFALGREQSQGALGFLQPRDGSDAHAEPAVVPRRAYGDLRVNSQPDRAQVLLLIGPGPALATDIPLGVAQEFIAMAEGHRPARALLPADGVWDELNGQPRYELAIQARPFHEARKPHNAYALGPTLLPQNVGAATGKLGSVRVVTTPRAAEVYQLIGFTPEVHVDNLPLDHAYELLVYAEGRKSVRKHIEPSDFIEQDGKRIARIDVQLPAAD
jgi:hypothetical protein